MKQLTKVAALLLLLSVLSFGQDKWTFDQAHSTIGFSISHLVISEVDGKFHDYEGTVETTKEDFSDAKVDFSIKVASIDTENKDRDEHLKADDFFNVAKFPEMTFKSKKMEKVGDNKYKLTGDLTMKGVTKEVVLDVKYNGSVKDPWGNTKAGFKISGMLNRFDYGLTFDKKLETGGLVVGKEVELDIKVELNKA